MFHAVLAFRTDERSFIRFLLLIDPSASNECKKIVVELILVGDHQPVGRSRVNLRYRVLDELR
jgi:hypothetical protein